MRRSAFAFEPPGDFSERFQRDEPSSALHAQPGQTSEADSQHRLVLALHRQLAQWPYAVRLCESVVPPAQGCRLDCVPTMPRASISSGVCSKPCYRGKFMH
jgi:hypothetical protein